MTTKKCSACGAEKNLTTEFFQKRKSSRDGFLGRCKVCVNSLTLQTDLSKKREHEKLTGFRVCKVCSEEKPLSNFGNGQNIRLTCSECTNAVKRDQSAVRRRADPMEFAVKERVVNARSRARKEGLAADIEYKDLLPLPTHCPIFGMELDYHVKRGARRENSATLDRIIPSKGYSKGNVVIVSHKANYLKKDSSLEDLKKIVAYIERHNKGA